MQTRLQSLVEAAVNIAVGFMLAGVITYWLFGVSVCRAAWVTCIYTAASLVRQYVLRRAFNRWHK